MEYLVQMNIWFLVTAFVIGFAVGAWIWARPRHRVELTAAPEDAPLARTLERAPASSVHDVMLGRAEPSAPLTSAPVDANVADAVFSAVEPRSVETGGDKGGPFLSQPQGDADDLKRLKGVGPKLTALLGELGVFHYHQIASWTDEDVAAIDERLGTFKGRIERDRWREQAQLLADGKFDEFEQKFGAGSGQAS